MRIRLLLISLSIPVLLSAQKTGYDRIDSLREALKTIPADQQRAKAITLHDLATAYMHTANYVQAASYYTESLGIANQLNDELLIALIYQNMGILSYNQADYSKTEEYNKRALQIYEKRNDNIRKAELLKLMADNMLRVDDSLNARKYYQEAIQIFKKVNNKLGEAQASSNLSLTYYNRYPEKFRLAIEAQRIFDSIPTDNPMPAINAGNIGLGYFDIVRYNQFHLAPPGLYIPAGRKALLEAAEKYIRSAIRIAGSKHDVENSAYFTGVLAELQEFNGDYKNAYKNIRFYFETNDSLFSQSNKNQIAALQNKQEIDLKNAEIATRKLQVRNQRTQLLLMAGGLLLVGIIGIFLYRESKISKKNNRVLEKLNKELATANQVKAKFFAILSHDLRSPIARLVSFLQFRKMQPAALNAQQAEQHEQKIRDAAENLLTTMEGMLLWSKDQMERFQPVMHTVPVASVFESTRLNFNNVETVSFIFNADEDLALVTDENCLRTILHNLTSNAVNALKSTEAATIEWRAWRENGSIFLSVADNGPGIPADRAPKFFEEQVATDSRHGLGLHIVRDLTKAIGCTLSVAPSDKGLKILLQFKDALPPAL